jgi:hypothetical protein
MEMKKKGGLYAIESLQVLLPQCFLDLAFPFVIPAHPLVHPFLQGLDPVSQLTVRNTPLHSVSVTLLLTRW